MKAIFTFVSFTFIGFLASAQSIVIPSNGKDATLSLQQGSISNGYPDHQDLAPLAWTNGGEVIYRVILDFDWSVIPENIQVDSAKLLLFHNPQSLNNNAQHSSLSGPNTLIVSRVREAWNEANVNWNNQPAISPVNEVLVPQTTETDSDLEADITDLIADLIADSSNQHGLLIKLEEEVPYRCVIYSSSDHPNQDLHPRIQLYYSSTASIEENAIEEVRLFPNPSKNVINVNTADIEFTIVNTLGQEFPTPVKTQSGQSSFDISSLPKGVYFLKSANTSNNITKKFIKI